MMVELALLLVLGLVGLAYLYMSHVYSYWRRKGLPQPPTVWGFGNILDAFIMKRGFGTIYTDIYWMFPGDSAVGVYGCSIPRLLVRSPQLIQRVMVSDFSSFHDNEFFVSKKVDPYFYEDPFVLKGEDWKKSRLKIISTVSTARVKEVFPLMKEIILRLNAYIDSNTRKDVKTKDLAQLFMMDNVSNIVFGIDSNCFSDHEAAFRKVADIQMKGQIQSWWKTTVFTCLPNVRDLLGLKFVSDSVTDYMRILIKQILEMRKSNGVKRNDLFDYVMSRENGDDIEELMNYGILFFLEGFETSSMTAGSVLYELAVNPLVQETLHDEINTAFGEQHDFDFDTLSTLPYLDKVIKETMRKYPITYVFIRECTKAVTLEVDGRLVEVEPGTPVIVPVFAVQRDPQYFPDPERFDPERFSEDSVSARSPYTYLPFGEGPRTCPGIKFGLTQVKLLVASLVLNYRILRTEKTPSTLTFMPCSFLVVPNEEEWVKLEKRELNSS